MTNQEKYDLLAEGGQNLSSGMAVIPTHDVNFEPALIEKALISNKHFKLKAFSPIQDFGLGEKAFNAQIEYDENTYSINLYLDLVTNLNLHEYRFGNNVEQELIELATQQKYFVGVSMSFSDDILKSFHLQLKVLNAIVPDASLCVDFMSLKLLSPQWLAMTAKSMIPPSPDYLYTIHAVYNDEPDGTRHYWLHTHGLHRCGSVELEMIDITQYPEEMNTMLNMAAKRLLNGSIAEQERFMIGYDGMGIDLCWLRWEKALKDFADDVIGGFNDRKDDNDIHAEPVGVLYAVQEGNMSSPEIYGATLAENPIYYISNEETYRMSCLAKERFAFYTELFKIHAPKEEKKSFLSKIFASGKPKESESSWRFLVKLGLHVDNDKSGSEKEHLWYDVLSIEGDKITGRLLNQPYWISGLNEGDIKIYPLELLTDWLIYGPESTYTSDTIYELGYK
ncbi:MAG: DUF4026 domain-containing protein [Dysgonomonas sp.]|uniref:DUF4026 domain-containing protein n=1 Tax=Dysgonomonas sp. TaxID=1891233 RepID=UPI0039E50E35